MSRVYCCVYNGLGNQLFGYALGMYISRRYNKELHVDLTKLNTVNFLSKIGFKKDTPREYELDKLGFVHPIKRFQHHEFTRESKIFNKNKCRIADYRKAHHDMGAIDEQQKIYTIGWGDFNIVQEVVPELRERFSPNFKQTPKFKQAEKLILEKNAVAIHIRRTDYINPNTGNRFSGICTDEYYENAISYIKKNIEDPYFIVFSDDVEYVKKNLKLENSYVVGGNPGYADLFLMSKCNHFILANSTFGFWAAILNNKTNKIVCTPKYWYNNPLENESYIPEEWIKIDIG